MIWGRGRCIPPSHGYCLCDASLCSFPFASSLYPCSLATLVRYSSLSPHYAPHSDSFAWDCGVSDCPICPVDDSARGDNSTSTTPHPLDRLIPSHPTRHTSAAHRTSQQSSPGTRWLDSITVKPQRPDLGASRGIAIATATHPPRLLRVIHPYPPIRPFVLVGRSLIATPTPT